MNFSYCIIFILPIFQLASGQRHIDDDDHESKNCPRNQRWFRCGPPCGDRKCPSSRDSGFKCMTSQRCGDSGCYCDHDLFKNPRGDCVSENQCPSFCPANEEMNRCGNRCENKCPISPSDVNDKHCPLICDPPACACKKGFYRSSNGDCVDLDRCPNFCNFDEVYNPCGSECENTCQDFNAGRSNSCPRICHGQGACVCKNGLYRNSRGRCVRPFQCSDCDHPNEESKECAPPIECQEQCDQRDKGEFCDRSFGHCTPGCVCKRGFIRSRGECMPLRNCERRPNFDGPH